MLSTAGSSQKYILTPLLTLWKHSLLRRYILRQRWNPSGNNGDQEGFGVLRLITKTSYWSHSLQQFFEILQHKQVLYMLLQGLEIVQTKLHMSGRDQRTCGPALKISFVQVYQRHWPSHHRLCRLSHQQGKKSLIAEKTMATMMVTISCGDDPRKFFSPKVVKVVLCLALGIF